MPAKMPDWLKTASNFAAVDVILQQRRLPGAQRPDLGDIAIDLEHGVVAEHLHAAIDDDLAAVLADMAQFAGPVALARSWERSSTKSIGNFVCSRAWLLRPIASSGENP